MQLTNSKDGFGLVAVTLHWVIAVAILYQIWLGDRMTEMEDYASYPTHKSIGITILAFSVLRLLLRLINPPPPLPEHMPWWERLGAHLSHWAFYGLMIGIPLTGWAMVSPAPDAQFASKTMIWGWFNLPPLPGLSALGEHQAVTRQADRLHALLATGVYVLLALHVLAALKHHLWDRDNVLTRMLPFLPVPRSRK